MSRRDQIEALLNERGFQSVSAMAEVFSVDPSTIRRDLITMERGGRAIRTHGGALPASPSTGTPGVLPASSSSNDAYLNGIGKAMAHRIIDGQSVLLSGGRTVLHVARHLRDHESLTIITNDLRIALEVSGHRNANLVFVGGELLPNTEETWGPLAITALDKMRVDVVVFGADTANYDGVYSSSSYDIELRRKMRAIAADAYFVADSTKFGREALFKLFEIDEFTAGITDTRLDAMRAANFRIPIICARPE